MYEDVPRFDVLYRFLVERDMRLVALYNYVFMRDGVAGWCDALFAAHHRVAPPPGAAGGGGMSADTLAEDTDVTIALHRAGWRVVFQEHARAWTEAPGSPGQLWQQRYRWSYGTMQALWKHRRHCSTGALGAVRPGGAAAGRAVPGAHAALRAADRPVHRCTAALHRPGAVAAGLGALLLMHCRRGVRVPAGRRAVSGRWRCRSSRSSTGS